MKKIIISTLILLAAFPQFASAWGRHGHDAIAAIAEANLNPKTKKIVESYLDGSSIVRYSTWMDDARRLPAYAYTNKSHVFYVDENLEPLMGANFDTEYKPDALCELLNRIEMAKDYKSLDDSTVAVTIKMIVHLVGDLHCPGHIFYAGKPSSSSIKCHFFEHPGVVKYHTIWDEILIDSVHKWNYLEYVHQFNRLSKKQISEVTAGGPVEWARGNAARCHFIYDLVSFEGVQEIDKDTAFWKMEPLADTQIQLAGYRLASVLNSVFK